MTILPLKQFVRGDRVYVRSQRVWLILVAFVMSGDTRALRTLTYGELAERMGLDARAAVSLGRELGVVGHLCIRNGLPALNCIVVNEHTGQPGRNVLLPPGKKLAAEQRRVLQYDWFGVRVPTTGMLREIWREMQRNL